MIFTTPHPDLPRGINAQREYVESMKHGIAFASHDHNRLWIWRFNAADVEPGIREGFDAETPYFVFAYDVTRERLVVRPLQRLEDWLTVGTAAVGEQTARAGS